MESSLDITNIKKKTSQHDSEIPERMHFDDKHKLTNFVHEYFSKKLHLKEVKVVVEPPKDEGNNANRTVLQIYNEDERRFKVVCIQNTCLEKSLVGPNSTTTAVPLNSWYISEIIDCDAITNEKCKDKLISTSSDVGSKRKNITVEISTTNSEIHQNTVSKKLKNSDLSTTLNTKPSMNEGASSDISNGEVSILAGNDNRSSVTVLPACDENIEISVSPKGQSLNINSVLDSDQCIPIHNQPFQTSDTPLLNQTESLDVELAQNNDVIPDQEPSNSHIVLSPTNSANNTHNAPETISGVGIKTNVQSAHTEPHRVSTRKICATAKKKDAEAKSPINSGTKNDKHSKKSLKKAKFETENTNKPVKARLSTKKENKNSLKSCENIHPFAPLGQVWIETLKNSSNSTQCSCISNGRSSIYTKLQRIGNGSSTHPSSLDAGGSLLGRKWVWDEGYYLTDGNENVLSNKNIANHNWRDGTQMLPGRTRRSGGTTSLKLSQVISELAGGKLNPHTLISTDPYNAGPEYRFVDKDIDDKVLMRTLVREFGGVNGIQPFSVCISPDAMFLADLHAHLVDCEIIGLLGGRWDQEERCVYIQAAFPCRSLTRSDSGHTDVEMDPVSQAQNVIQNHGLRVLGWYHSHPSFQPDPSVVDVENQGNYQNLFYSMGSSREHTEKSRSCPKVAMDGIPDPKDNCPFVGLIVGTYDPRNPTSKSIIKWFHAIPKETGNVASSSSVNNLVINESGHHGPTKERIHFPIELKVSYRCFRHSDPKNNSRESLTLTGRSLRRNFYDSNFKSYIDRKKAESGERNNRPQASPTANAQDKELQPVTKNFDFPSKMSSNDVSGNRPLDNTQSETNMNDDGDIQTSIEEKDAHIQNTSRTNYNTSQSSIVVKDICDTNEKTCATTKNHVDTADAAPCLASIEQSFSFTDGVHLMHTSNIIDYKPGSISVPIQQGAEKVCHNVDVRWNNEQFERSKETVESKFPERNQGPPDYYILNVNGRLSDAFSVTNICERATSNVDHKTSSKIIERNSSRTTTVNSNKKIQKPEPPLNPKYVLPLPFTKKEFSLLMVNTRSLNDEEKAVLIWNAVEREQTRKTASTLNHDKNSSDWAKKNISQNNFAPASSSSILNSLFLPFMASQVPDSETSVEEKTNLFNGVNSAADIVLIDAIDAVLSYYSVNPHRVDMLDIWNGGSNIISSINHSAASSLSTVLAGSSATSLSNGGKIKKGVKLCGSLLRWCKKMQLNTTQIQGFSHQYCAYGNSSSSSQSQSFKISNDNSETSLYFITQVMRLVAAKWREADEPRIKMKKKKNKKHTK